MLLKIVSKDNQSQSRQFSFSVILLRIPLLRAGVLAIGLWLTLLPASSAYANCVIIGTTVTCDTAAPNPYTVQVGAGPTSNNFTVTLAQGSQIFTGDSPGISLGSGSTIILGQDTLVQNAGVANLGPYNAGSNTIEFDSNTTLTINSGALVYASGTQAQSEAINLIGDGNVITNHGTIRGEPGAAVYFDNQSVTTGTENVLDNFGTIIAGANNLAFGASSSRGIVFTQETGATVTGNLIFDDGNNTLNLFTDSIINGIIQGGAGSNLITLNGTGTETMSGAFINFGTLIKKDTGTWTLTDSLGNFNTSSVANPLTAEIAEGTLVLTGNNAAFLGSMTVDGPGILSATAASMLPVITDNGLVLFNQPTDGTYSGLISGTGALEKTAAGALTITSDNPYTGGTIVTAGTLVVGNTLSSSAALSGVGQVQVATGASLTGYGLINGTVINNGIVGAGNSLDPLTNGPAGTLTVTGITNAAMINIAGHDDVTLGNVLNVQGNYNAFPGSTVTLGAVLNVGGPLSNQITDRLLITGNATGSTPLILQTSYLGGLTGRTAADGISLVQVAGTSSLNAFTLEGGFVIDGSPFIYSLSAFGPASPNGPADPSENLVGNPSNYWDYRLQNDYLDNGTTLVVAPQVPSYVSVPIGIFSAQFEDLSELHRRLGEIRIDSQTATYQQNEIFIRTYGSTQEYKSDKNFDNYGYNFSDDYAAMQIGGNHMVIDNASGKLRAGLAGMLGHLWVKPNAINESKVSMDTETLAAIFTWQSRKEWYVDTILSGGWFQGPVTTPHSGKEVSLSGNGLAASAEAGYPINLGWHNLVLEPEAQLIYGHLNFAKKTDINGIVVDLGVQNQGLLRAGARLLQNLSSNPDMRITSYVEANLLKGLNRNNTILLSNIPFSPGNYGNALELRGGLSGNVNKQVSFYGDLGWQHDIGGNGFLGWGLNIGLKYAF